MTPLRQRMFHDLQLRGYSDRTVQAYVRAVVQLARHGLQSRLQVRQVGDPADRLLRRATDAGLDPERMAMDVRIGPVLRPLGEEMRGVEGRGLGDCKPTNTSASPEASARAAPVLR